MIKIVVIGSFKRIMYATAFYHSWKALGYDVYQIDDEDYSFQGNGIVARTMNKIQDKYHIGFLLRKYNNDIIKIVNGVQPDFVFLYRCYNIHDRTLKTIKDKTVIFSYNNDDPFISSVPALFKGHFVSNGKYCDMVYVYRRKNIEDFKQIGVDKTKVLLPYYLTSTNFPIPNLKKDIPVAFVGHFEDDGRDAIIKTMYEAGIPVTIYGKDYWITQSSLYHQLKPIIKEPKSGAGYNELLNRVQIALVFLSQRNNDTYTRRCFEIPAAKTLMLAPYTKDLDELFPEDECAVYYRSTEDLIQKCKYLLANPEIVNKIANAGYERLSVIGGSEIDRCKEIIKDFEIIKKEKQI